MPATYVYKAEGDRGKHGIFLTPQEDQKSAPYAILPDGTRVDARYVNTNEGRHQYLFGDAILNQKGVKIYYNGKTIDLEDSNKSYEGSNPYDGWEYRNKGDLGSGGGSGGGGGPFGADTVGDFGVAPAFIGDLFPKAVTSTYNPIPGAAKDYQYIDPIKFGKEFNPFQREELAKNFAQSRDFALGAIDTEFQALLNFVPSSAKLQREQVAADNIFNQEQRTAQVQGTLPEVLKDIAQQRADARAYARGELPDSIQNRGLEVQMRSESADIASSSGFGTGSAASRKLSDLMSARERFGIAQYGNQLEASVDQREAELLLAPTEYATAGSQVRVTPTLSGSQLQQAGFETFNASTILSPGTAFSSAVNQSQFLTQLQQRIQEFNASNTLQNDQFNVTNLNNFALSYFNYLNSYVNSVASAAQADINTNVSIDQQGEARDEATKQRDKTKKGNAIEEGLGALGGIIGGIAGFSDLRLKDNITPYGNALDTLKKLKVFNYTYKENTVAADGGKKHVGIAAQDLQFISPHSVGLHESGFFQIDPSELIYILIAAVQELANGR